MKRKIMLELTQGEAETLLQVLGQVEGNPIGPVEHVARISDALKLAGAKPAHHRIAGNEMLWLYGWDGTL